MHPTITLYFSLLSPWSYMGHEELLRIAQQHNATIAYKPINLMPIFNEMGGAPLSKRHPSRQAYRWHELRRWAKRRNIPLTMQPQFFPFDSQLANCVVLSLLARGIAPEAFMLQAFEGTWLKELNLADEQVVSAILNGLGLPATEIIEQAKSAEIIARYDAFTQEAMQDGVFGVPFMILNGEPFWGQDRLDFLEEALAAEVTIPQYVPQ